MSALNSHNGGSGIPEEEPNEDAMLDAEEAGEEIVPEDEDQPMDSDGDEDEEMEISIQNDSIGHFDKHQDSVFSITSHPLDPSIIATGSGDDTAYVFSAAVSAPLLPASYESNPKASRDSLTPIAHLTGHTDSVNTLSFSLPNGEYLVTAGMDGRLRAYTSPPANALSEGPYSFLAEAQEVEEIIWLQACPHPSYPNTFALGANDGSVWVYTVDSSSQTPLQVVQAYYLHSAPTTAGAWSASGSLLASVSEDSTLYVYDPFGDAAAANVSSTGQALISLTPDDQRFAVDGGLYSVAFAPGGAFLATGGAGGLIRIVGLPLLNSASAAAAGSSSATKSQKGSGARSKAGGSKQGGSAAPGQAGQILASLQAQSDGIETLAFAPAPLTMLAAGSVDGSIALFDTAHQFAVRRLIRDAHDGEAVVQVSFADAKGAGNGGSGAAPDKSFVLTSCGMDGVVKRWDTRGGSNASSGMGLIGEWKGHRGGGEGGGVLGFVVGLGKVVTAGDDGITLVFDIDRS
jgi:ribosome assembly protein SQT1